MKRRLLVPLPSAPCSFFARSLAPDQQTNAVAGIFVAFVAPKVYETYKDHIDEGIAHAKTQGVKGYDVARGHLNQVVDKVPVLKNMRAGMAKKVE
jgi:hypothetical protein